MKNLFVLLLTILLWSNLISAQTNETVKKSKFNVHVEAATVLIAHPVSINFEVKFPSIKPKKIHWYGKFGYLYTAPCSFCTDDEYISGALLGVTMLTGRGNHHFEVNGDIFLGTIKENEDPRLGPLVNIGYRFQKPEGGIIFRTKIGLTGAGIGLGYAF